MGSPMASHLTREHTVCVHNRTRTKAQAWLTQQAPSDTHSIAQTAKAAAQFADVLLCCVNDDEQAQAVFIQDENAVIKADCPPALVIDHSSAAADTSQRIAEQLAARNIRFLDAPVSGGEEGAKQGTLTIMCGGAREDFLTAQPIMQSYAKHIKHIGPTGSGQLCKLVNQVCVAGVLQGLAEGMHLAEQAGLDLETVFSTIGQGAAGSWQMQNRYTTMAKGEYDFGFAIDLMRKDLSNTLKEANRLGAALPITSLVDQFYAKLQTLNGGNWDTSALIETLRHKEPTHA